MARPAEWNHNVHYHDLVLRSIPQRFQRALDVGCGTGLLARRLAERCKEVVAIDRDPDTIAAARAASGSNPRLVFVEGDVMTYPLPNDSFDVVTAIATLHHLPLKAALERFRDLLRTSGVLIIVGLYRAHAIEDYAWAAAALPVSWALRCVRGQTDVAAPVKDPQETLTEIRDACNSLLPGVVFRRQLLFRYSITWCKP